MCLHLRQLDIAGYWSSNRSKDMVHGLWVLHEMRQYHRSPSFSLCSPPTEFIGLSPSSLTSPTLGTGSCYQNHSILHFPFRCISHLTLWLLVYCPSFLTHNKHLEGKDNFYFVHHWFPRAWHIVKYLTKIHWIIDWKKLTDGLWMDEWIDTWIIVYHPLKVTMSQIKFIFPSWQVNLLDAQFVSSTIKR